MAMSLPQGTQNHDELPCGIIGRIVGDHDLSVVDIVEIIETIAQQLFIYINLSDVSYRQPNFIIRVHNPITQVQILSNAVLHIGGVCLELVPWCKEHELAKLPWITANSPRIMIDPLIILPRTPWNFKEQTGAANLKFNIAKHIPCGYELKAPDFSYILIAELKDLYEAKFSLFLKCDQISREVIAMRDELYMRIEELACSTCICTDYIEQDESESLNQGSPERLRQLIGDLFAPTVWPLNFYAILDESNLRKVEPLQLHRFSDAPMHSEVPLPKTFTARLKTIYTAVIERVYNAKPIVETIRTQEGRFQTYITIGDSTKRHHGGFKKTAVEQEAAAIIYSLKHITHMMGFSIVDHNYPTLCSLIDHINTWNAQLNNLHFRAAHALTETESMHESLSYLCPSDFSMPGANRCTCLDNAMKEILSLTDDHLTIMMDKCSRFIHLKSQYYSSWNRSYCLSLQHYMWSPANRPLTALPSDT